MKNTHLSILFIMAGGYNNAFSQIYELSDSNVNLINNISSIQENTVFTTHSGYQSDNSILSANGRWLNYRDNNESKKDIEIAGESITVKNYNFNTNTTKAAGGALLASGSVLLRGKINFENNSITSNHQGNWTAPEDITGGAISSLGKSLNIVATSGNQNVTFLSNSILIGDIIGEGGKGVNAYGGAIYAGSIQLLGNNSTYLFERNEITSKKHSSYGGAIYSADNISMLGDRVNFLFKDNKAYAKSTIGGALYLANAGVDRHYAELSATNSHYSFIGNIAEAMDSAQGGAIGSAGGGVNGVDINLLGDNSIYSFDSNSAKSITEHKGYASYGGAIFIAGNLNAHNASSEYKFINNKVQGDQSYGGAIAVVTTGEMYQSVGIGQQIANLNITNSKFINNSAIVDLAVNIPSSALGGAIYLSGANINISGNNEFTENKTSVLNSSIGYEKINSNGGAIYCNSSFKVGNDSNGIITDDIDAVMNISTSNNQHVIFKNNMSTVIDKDGLIAEKYNDIYFDGSDIGVGSYTLNINTIDDSSVQMLSSISSSDTSTLAINKLGSGDWVLAKNNALLGEAIIKIKAGSLYFYDSDTVLTANGTNNSGLFIESNGAIYGRHATFNGKMVNNGVLYIGDDITSSLINTQSFTINGDYIGNHGLLVFNSALGADNSLTDKLIIKGDTSGTSYVTINNLGGKGDKTINGIELIEIKGNSLGVFEKQGRIVSGMYDYDLIKKGNNWYLTSSAHEPIPEPTPKPNPSPSLNVRPEPASYTANLAAANTMFTTRLHDRLGETQYIDVLTGEKKVTSMWIRQVGGHNVWRDSTGKLKTQSNRYVMQLGGDIAQWSMNGLDRWHLGLMAGYGYNSSNTRSSSKGYRSDGSVNGYSAGLYATWYANDDIHQGTYLDMWAQYSWFNNSIKGQIIQYESYKSSGVTGSLELGYSHKFTEFMGNKGGRSEWFIQPQAQITWMGVETDIHQEENGTRVNIEGDGNVQSRIGLRTFIRGHNAIDDGKEREFQPFVEVNWLHNTRVFSTKMDGRSSRQEGGRNLGEIKTGIEGQINPQLNVWGNIGVQMGDKGYNDSSLMIGVKYNFM